MKIHAISSSSDTACSSWLFQHWYHQFWFIWRQQLPSVLLFYHACYSLFLKTATVCCWHTCIILLHETDTAALTKPTDCSSLTPSVLNSLLASTASNSYDIIPVSDLKQQQAVTALWRFYVCIVQFFIGNVDNTIRHPDKLVMFIVIKLQISAAVFFPIVPHV